MSEDASKPQSVINGREKMTDEELLTLIRAYEMASLGSSVAAGATISTTVYPSNQAQTTLEIDRYNALNMYFARPLGNEIENRSQVVLPELRDTIEWIMPQIMRMFVGSKQVCRFDAENPQDEQQAEMETAVVNHVFMQGNNGFFILHDFFKDAMLMRNGYAKIYWQEESHSDVERYTGLTELEVASLMQEEEGTEIEVLEQREYTQTLEMPIMQAMPGAPPQPAPPPIQFQCFDLKIRRTSKKGRVCVTCIPPEEMRVTPRAREGMEDLAFTMHKTERARSDLISDGYDEAWVNSLAAGRPNWLDMDALARNQVVDQMSVESPSDRSMQDIEVREAIMRVDYDGDGVAELRRIIVGGEKIGENEEIEETCFASCVPKRMPHRHTGISLYDELADIQIIKTTLFRQGLDNLTISNNQRVAVDWKNANFDDLLTSRPGGVVRGTGPPSNWIMPLEQPSNLVQQVLPALDYIDKLKTVRTGVGSSAMGVDADELQNVTKGAQLAAMSAASLKIELVARLLAEGVKDIFKKIHGELIRHQDKPMEFQMSGKWVQVNPSEWSKRSKISVNVGLGSGNREEMRTNVQMLTAMQVQLGQIGLVGPKQAYETFKLGCEALGFDQPERFAMDPAGQEYAQHMAQMKSQPPPPNPALQVAQIKAQSSAQSEQSKSQREVLKLQGQLADSKMQLVHEALQQHADRGHENTQNTQQQMHDGLQGHKDREIQLDQNHLQIILKLIPAIAQILAAEKQAANQLGSDVTQAASSIQ